jgi:predicted HTH transcriptional regulator
VSFSERFYTKAGVAMIPLEGRVVEQDHVKYKRGWNPLYAIHPICAFANDFTNTNGGYIVISIEEQDGLPILHPVGVEENKLGNIQKELFQFEDKRIRTAWNEDEQEWYFSIVDVVGVFTDQATHRRANAYWAVLKKRLIEEGFELLAKCKQLKMTASGGNRP